MSIFLIFFPAVTLSCIADYIIDLPPRKKLPKNQPYRKRKAHTFG